MLPDFLRLLQKLQARVHLKQTPGQVGKILQQNVIIAQLAQIIKLKHANQMERLKLTLKI